MDAKELKLVLKQAREAIKEKEFKTALKHCKTVLNADKSNYNAWVFVGVAAQEMEQYMQAEEAFQRAIKISPDELLAWQGLSNFYEKQNDKDKLCGCLVKLVKLSNKDEAKQAETLQKLLSLTKDIKSAEKVVEVLQLKLQMCGSNEAEQYSVQKEILQELSNKDHLSSRMEDLKVRTAEIIVSHSEYGMKDCKEIIIPCMQDLYEMESVNKILELIDSTCNEECKRVCMEYLLRSAIETYIKEERIVYCLEEVVYKVKEIHAAPLLCYCIDGVLNLDLKKYTDSLDQFRKGLESSPNDLDALQLLCKTMLLLHMNSDAEKCAISGLRIATKTNSNPQTVGRFYLFLGEALANTRNWEASFKAYEKCMEHLGRTPEVLKSFFFALVEVGQKEKAQKVYAELSSSIEDQAVVLQLEGQLHIIREELPSALKKLRESVSLRESAFTLYLIGRVLWEMKEYEKASKVFAKSAGIDPYFSKNFLYLGHYYMQLPNHERAARKFYQKAFDLDVTDEETGLCLSKVLKVLGEHDENIELLKKVTECAPLCSCKWGWTQLGLLQLEKDLASEAVFSFQNAIRADPHSNYIWECLGDAYLKRGSHESALKAYEKSAELNPKAMYPLYQVSTIQKARGLFEDAVVRFKNLLTLGASYIPALIGLAETLLLLAKKYFSECLYGRSKDCLQEMLHVLSRVLPTTENLSCLWKLAGDACTFYFHFGNEWELLKVPPEFLRDIPHPSTKFDLLSIGAKFYGRALSLNSKLSTLWHDLGMNLYFQSVLSTSSKLDFSQKAFLCLQKAVSIAPGNHEHWLGLGTIAAVSEIQDYAIAQHAFIKAIEIEKNNVEAWTSLGILYLKNNNIYLAHAAFTVAQPLDPSYPLCWIGQAIVAMKEKHSETIDLFRHATTLGSHAEAFMGYGQAVCEALFDSSLRGTIIYKYNIEQMQAVSVACDCLIKYTDNIRSCAEAFNAMGVLLERQKLYRSALTAYQRALNLCNNPNNVEKFRTNYARLLNLTGNYEEAIAEYMKFKGVNIPLLCSFAYTLHRKKDFVNAYNVFDRALKTAQNPGDKSHIMVAMAMVKWAQRNSLGNSADAPELTEIQNLMLQSTQFNPPSVFGLLALWAFAVKKNQLALTNAVQKKLQSLKNCKEYIPSIALLTATQAFVYKGCHSARIELQRAIHSHPGTHDIWMQAAFCMLEWDSKYFHVVDTFSKVAVFHGSDKEQASQIFALSRLTAGYKKASLIAAQKAVHIQPSKLVNWITLAAACHVSDANRDILGWIYDFVKMLGRQGAKRDILGWLICTEAYHNMCQGAIEKASKLIKRAVNVSFNSQVQSVLQILDAFSETSDGKLDPLISTMKTNSNNFLCWMILSKLLIHQEKFADAEKTLQKFFVVSSKSFPKMKIYPLLQLAALSYKAANVTDDKAKWMKAAEDALTEAVKISPNNQAARFMQALIAIDNGNVSLARRSLEKVVFGGEIQESKWMESHAKDLLSSLYTAKNDDEALQKLSQRTLSCEDSNTLVTSNS